MFCNNCGFQNQPNAKFCARCGTKLATTQDAPALSAPQALSNMPTYPAQVPPVAPPPYYAAPPKSRSTALVLEILPALFGFLGFGWIYAGETQKGVMWLIGYLVWSVVGIILAAITVFIGCLCVLPVSIGLIYLSASRLNVYLKSRPDLFTP